MNYLLRSEADYADEFDIYGLMEITKEQRDKLISHNLSLVSYHGRDENQDLYEDDGDICFGTNEFVYYHDVGVTIVEVTDEELTIIKRVYDVKNGRKLNVGTLNLEGHL